MERSVYLLVNDEKAAQSNAIRSQDVVLLHDLALKVGHQRVGKITHASLVTVCATHRNDI